MKGPSPLKKDPKKRVKKDTQLVSAGRSPEDHSGIVNPPVYHASTILSQRLSQVEGVGQVVVGGSSLPAVRVELNPTELNSYGLGLQDVATMLRPGTSRR